MSCLIRPLCLSRGSFDSGETAPRPHLRASQHTLCIGITFEANHSEAVAFQSLSRTSADMKTIFVQVMAVVIALFCAAAAADAACTKTSPYVGFSGPLTTIDHMVSYTPAVSSCSCARLEKHMLCSGSPDRLIDPDLGRH
jgi:hypothetical protein